MRRLGWVVALIVTTLGLPAQAKTPFAQFDIRQFACPVGGKTFEQDVGYSSFPLITLPDGSWLGDTEISAQIPVCPENGLVLIPDPARSKDSGSSLFYAEYTAEERSRLPALIADPNYLALKADGPYAQAWWLATKLGRPAEDRFFMLQRSTWATRDPAKRKQLVERFAAEGPAIIAAFKSDDATRRASTIHIVNALRELNRFDAAGALLDRLETDGAPVPGPTDPESMHGPDDAAAPMRLAIEQKDDGRFAAELLPKRIFHDICDGRMAAYYGPTTAATRAACDIRSERELSEAANEQRAIALSSDAKALDAKCAAESAKQDRALTIACASRQRELDEKAGELLLADGASLSGACTSTAMAKQSGPLRSACISFDVAVASALGTQLADDGAAYAIICPGTRNAELLDRSEVATNACGSAVRLLDERLEAALVADPARLDTYCAVKDDQGYVRSRPDMDYGVLVGACSTLQSNRTTAKIDNLARNPAAFETECGRYGRTNAAGNDVFGLSEEQDQCRNAWRLRENRRAKYEAEAKGLVCLRDAIYSPDRPRCVPKAEYDAEMSVGSSPVSTKWDDGSSLMKAAHAHAAQIIARAKQQRTYPKREEGDPR